MQRQFKRFIQIDRKILEENNKYKIVDTEESFREHANHHESLHYLKIDPETQNLIWQKSKGPISDLVAQLEKDDSFCSSINEEKIFLENQNAEKILILSAEPGMGKSILLDRMTQYSNEENLFIKITLNSVTNILNDLQIDMGKLQNCDFMDLIFRKFLGKSDELEINVLKHLAEAGKLTLMFDGLDEVSEYKEQVKMLIKELNENLKLKKILITTRNHLKEELEDFFGTISFSLSTFNEEDQKKFLVKYWCQKRNLTEMQSTQKTEELIRNLKNTELFNETIRNLIGIPLQTRMIADIFMDELNNSMELKINNLSDLYDMFIETKLRIKFEEKYPGVITRERRRFEREKSDFDEDHKRLSSKIIFKYKDEILVLKFTEIEILEYGLIVSFSNGMPAFLHQSFAEYFVAQRALDKILKDKIDHEVLKIFQNRENFLIRRFLDDLICKNYENVSNEDLKKYNIFLQVGIERCCIENLFYLLRYFIEKKGALIRENIFYLLFASDGGHKEIVELLLTHTDININQFMCRALPKPHCKDWTVDQLNLRRNIFGNPTALHLASENGHVEVVKILLEKGINFKLRTDLGQTALHLASKNGHAKVVKILLENGIDINQDTNGGRTALNLASKNGHVEVVKVLLEKGIDFKLKTDRAETALHLASENGHVEVFRILLEKGLDIHLKTILVKLLYIWHQRMVMQKLLRYY
jgi:hypothetical protein